MLRTLWQYRYFVFSSVRNELFSRFARSKIGGLWMIINPLVQVAIYTLILSNVLSAKLPGIDNNYAYAVYLMAGLLAWTLFNETVGRCLNLFTEQANLIKRMQFPRITLPGIVICSVLLQNILLFFAMLLIFLLLGHTFSLTIIWLLPITLIMVGFALGIGLIMGVLNVFIRDVSQAVPIFIQMLFWFTPIIYPVSIIPDDYHHWLDFNPLYHIISAYQGIILYGEDPNISTLGVLAISTFLILLMSLYLYRRSREEMVDEL